MKDIEQPRSPKERAADEERPTLADDIFGPQADCPHARSSMTPCARRDPNCVLEDGRCVGCGLHGWAIPLSTPLSGTSDPATPASAPWEPATSPGHTDLMVAPETLDAFIAAAPDPAAEREIGRAEGRVAGLQLALGAIAARRIPRDPAGVQERLRAAGAVAALLVKAQKGKL